MNKLFSKIACAAGLGALAFSSQASAETITKDPIEAQITVKARTIFDVNSLITPLDLDLDEDSAIETKSMGTIGISMRDDKAYTVSVKSGNFSGNKFLLSTDDQTKNLEVKLYVSHDASGVAGSTAVTQISSGEGAISFHAMSTLDAAGTTLATVGAKTTGDSERKEYTMGLLFEGSQLSGKTNAEVVGNYTGTLTFEFTHEG